MIIAIAIFVLTLGFSAWASMRVKSTYNKYLQVPASSGISGAQCAAEILRAAGIHDVRIEAHDGMLSDHYNPLSKKLVLSHANYVGTSTAALGVAAHECGHAIQHKIAYAPLKWRMAAVGVTSYANGLVMVLPFLGMLGGFFHTQTMLMLMAGGWGIIMLFNLITLPVEFDASRRAKVILGKMNFIRTGAESTAVKEVLDAAAWTYVAAFLTSLVYFLWYLLPLLTGRRN
jgi:Zn-dependent membrane protease YugP